MNGGRGYEVWVCITPMDRHLWELIREITDVGEKLALEKTGMGAMDEGKGMKRNTEPPNLSSRDFVIFSLVICYLEMKILMCFPVNRLP
jgi:hypothetical protein